MELTPYKRGERNLGRLRDSMDELFNRFFEGVEWPWPTLSAGETWMPAMDIAERDDAIEIKAEVPGLKAEEIEVTVEGNTLNISGEKKQETEAKDKNYYRMERRYGSFRRTIPLPTEVDPGKIDAKCKDGVLTVTLPKSERVKPRKITIHPTA